MLQLPLFHLPRVIAHRGASAYAPENTLEAFREAKKRGATWVEIDVKLTADGVPIVLHDASLKRTLGIDRLVADMTAAELPAALPTFEATIACLGELGLGCNVEIKPCEGREAETARVTVETLRRCWPRSLPPPLLSSFQAASLAAARQAAPEFARAILLDDIEEEWRQKADAVGAAGINTNGRKLTAPGAVGIKQAGFMLAVYTINDPAVAKALFGMGADCVITDAPDVMQDLI